MRCVGCGSVERGMAGHLPRERAAARLARPGHLRPSAAGAGGHVSYHVAARGREGKEGARICVGKNIAACCTKTTRMYDR